MALLWWFDVLSISKNVKKINASGFYLEMHHHCK